MEKNLIWMLSAFHAEEKALEKAVKIAHKQKLPVYERVEVKSTGVGIKKSRLMLEKHLKGRKPDLVLITGIAGAVNPQLRAGDVVFPERVSLADSPSKIQEFLDIQEYSGIKIRERLKTRSKVHLAPYLATVKRTYHTEDKAMLRRLNPDIYAVDMESYSLVKVLQKNNIPFVFFRVISDPFNMKLPKDDFLEALSRSKGIKRILILFSHPLSSFRLVMIMPSLCKSLRRLKECAVVFISSALKPEAE